MVYVGVLIVLRQPRRKGRVPCTLQISAYYASLVLCRTQAGTGSYTAAIDLRSLSLIDAIQRMGRGSGRHLVPYSLRFTLTEPHRRHAARGPGGRTGAWSHTAVDLRSQSLIGAMRSGGTGGEGGGAQVGGGGEHRWGV